MQNVKIRNRAIGKKLHTYFKVVGLHDLSESTLEVVLALRSDVEQLSLGVGVLENNFLL